MQKARLAIDAQGVVVFTGSEKAAKAKMKTAIKLRRRIKEQGVKNTSGLLMRVQRFN